MPGKNRKKHRVDSSLLHVPFTGVVILVVLGLLGYVWLGCCCEAVGREIKKLEVEERALATQLEHAKCRWQQLKTPASLVRALSRHGLVMRWPPESQIVRLRVCDLQPLQGAPPYYREQPRLASLDRREFRE